MTSIIVGFSTPKKFNLFSSAIKSFAQEPYSHAYVRYQDEVTGEWIVYQASGMEVNQIAYENFQQDEIIVAEFEVPVSESTKAQTILWAEQHLGVKYGVKHIIGLVFVLLARRVGKKIKNPFADGGATMVCCELVAVILDELILDSDDIDFETCVPKDVFNFMVSKGYKRIV